MQFGQAVANCKTRPQTSSSSKSVSPALRANETLTRFLISRSDLQCFSHEEGCFAAGHEVHEQLVRTAQRRTCPIPDECPVLDSSFDIKQAAVQTGCYHSSLTEQTSIFERKTLPVRLRDQKASAFLARREEPAFFDEDGVCSESDSTLQPV